MSVIDELFGTSENDPSPESKILDQLGLVDLSPWKRERSAYLAFVAWVVGIGFLVCMAIAMTNSKAPGKIVAGVLPIIVLSIGYQQWRAARNEISLDKYYDRLGTANESFNKWRLQVLVDDKPGMASHLGTMFVFAELDLLEYILSKRRLGYVRLELAERCIRAFGSRCLSSEFTGSVLYWIGETDEGRRAGGYEEVTRRAARLVIEDRKERRVALEARERLEREERERREAAEKPRRARGKVQAPGPDAGGAL